MRLATGWAAGGAAALTAAFAFGASRGAHQAKAATRSGSAAGDSATQDALPQTVDPQTVVPQAPQSPYPQGYAPPSASTAPPSGMSGGS